MRGRKSDQAVLGGNSLLDCVVYARVAGAACAKYVLGVSAEVTSLSALAGGGRVEGRKVTWPSLVTVIGRRCRQLVSCCCELSLTR